MKLDIERVRGAIFDVDGTLLDSMNTWFTVGVRYLETLGIYEDESLGLTLFSMTMTEAAEYMIDKFSLLGNKPFQEKIVSKVGSDRYTIEIAEFFGKEMARGMKDFYVNDVMPRKGAIQLLEYFDRKNIPMSVATSTHIDLLKPALDRLGMTKYFKAIISASALNISKGTPEPFKLCLNAMNLKADKGVWVFEDGLYAIKTAKKMGLSTVAIFDEISKGDWEEAVNIADINIKELDELI